MARRPANDNLTAMEILFVKHYLGSGVEAAKKAGYKEPKCAAYKLLKRPAIIAALAAKKVRMERAQQEVEREQIAEITINRNEIVNELAKLGRSAESESARVSALLGLADIFLLRVKNVRDINKFHGWTADELDEYARTGTVPERFRSVFGSGGRAATSLRTEKV